MNKFLKVMMVSSMAVGLFGCSSAADEATDDTNGTIVVGTSGTYSLWTQTNLDNDLEGFEMDMWSEIGERANYKVEYKIAEFSALFGMIDSGAIDTIANEVTPNDAKGERRKKYDFSEYYAFDSYLLTIRDDADYGDLDNVLASINDGTILAAVDAATNPRLILEKILTDTGYDVEECNIAYLKNTQGLLAQIASGQYDVTLGIQAQTEAQIAELGLGLQTIPTGLGVPIAYPFQKDNEEATAKREAVSAAITDMLADGTVAELCQKWFNTDLTTNIPAE